MSFQNIPSFLKTREYFQSYLKFIEVNEMSLLSLYSEDSQETQKN